MHPVFLECFAWMFAERSANAVIPPEPLHTTTANYRTGCFEISAAWFFDLLMIFC